MAQSSERRVTIFLPDNEVGKRLRTGFRRRGVAGEKTFHARVIAPGQRRRILPRLVGNHLVEPVPAGKCLQPRRLHEHLGRAQFLFTRQGPSLFQQRGPVPAGPSKDAGVHRPQVHGHQQTAGQQRQSEDGAN